MAGLMVFYAYLIHKIHHTVFFTLASFFTHLPSPSDYTYLGHRLHLFPHLIPHSSTEASM